MSGDPPDYEPQAPKRRVIQEPDPNLMLPRFKYAAMRLGVEGILFPQTLTYHLSKAMGFSYPAIVYVMGSNRYFSQFKAVI